MTIPIITLTCTSCGLQQSSGIGSHEYVLDDGRTLGVLKQSGWCHACGGIRSIEVLDARRWIAVIAEVRDELASVKTTGRGWWRGLQYEGSLFGYRQCVPINPSTAHAWSRRLDEALFGLDLLAGRRSGPRCLTCGSTQVEPPREMGSLLTHPGCNGSFEAELTGDIMIRAPSQSLRYTSEGELLDACHGDVET